MYPSSYHNTTSAQPKKAKARAVKCGKQEMYILEIFESQESRAGYTPWEVFDIILDDIWNKVKDIPDKEKFRYGGGLNTSVKRSITNLKNAGKLIATKQRKAGRLGKENKVYKINQI